MDVQLYVYDLSNGMAKAFSQPLLGVHIEAVYHTSIVMEGVEYVYDGGIKMVDPGRTHLGRPMEVIPLGQTELPLDVVLEYVESCKQIYTQAAYDLFSHNCNNFSNDLATFLLGKGIPEKIVNLPQTVLDTPFGRALQPELNRMIEKKRPNGLLGIDGGIPEHTSQVHRVTTATELDKLLEEAERSCAVIFFTSDTCRPCLPLYPVFEELAQNAGKKCTFIKIDVSRAFDIATEYAVHATPTFMTFLHGEKEKRWAGADRALLQRNIDMLIRMAWPPHPHSSLALRTFRQSNTRPVLYSKVPPLGKLKAKMGITVAEDASVASVLKFISIRAESGPAEATLPDLDTFSRYVRSSPSKLPLEILFTIVDLLRVALVDPRFSGYYAEEKGHKTIAPLIEHINNLSSCPYSLRIVTLQMACNLFSSPLYPEHILGCPSLTTPIINLITTSLLDADHTNVRIAAASLAFNIATSNSVSRTEQKVDLLPSDHQIELAASLLEAIKEENESAEAMKGSLLAFAFLIYCIPSDNEGGMMDLLESLDARGTIEGKRELFANEGLIGDIVGGLLGKA